MISPVDVVQFYSRSISWMDLLTISREKPMKRHVYFSCNWTHLSGAPVILIFFGQGVNSKPSYIPRHKTEVPSGSGLRRGASSSSTRASRRRTSRTCKGLVLQEVQYSRSEWTLYCVSQWS